jgi:hypothetical protein
MRMLPVASLGLAALLLSGCLPQSHTATPTPQPSSTPVFASDEEALAAAEAAYAEYLRVSDAITADGGANPERIEPLVTVAQYQVELDGFQLYQSKGWKTAGSSQFETLELQNYSENGDGSADISMYVCSDISNQRVVDSNGLDVTPADLPTRQTLQVSMIAELGPPSVRLDGTEIWDSAQGC